MPDSLVYVAVCPRRDPDESGLPQAAALLNKDVPTLRMLLSAVIPRLVAHFPGASEAELAIGQLKALGFKAFACPDADLRRDSSALQANNLVQVDSDLVFNNRAGASLALPAAAVFLIVQGLRHDVQEQETTRTSVKLNLTATLLTGGIPLFKRVEKKAVEQTSTQEYFVRLYGPADPEARVEIRQRDFDYSFLGARVAPSSQANLFLAVQELRRFYPSAIFDDRLLRPLANPSGTALGWDSVNVNCKLVYWEHRL
jgi:hypothetical protein